MTPNDPDFENLVVTWGAINKLTSRVQDEIVSVLMKDPKRRDLLAKQLRKSENEMQLIMDKAVHQFVDTFLLATANHSNLFMQALSIHPLVTGDDTLERVFHEINRRTLEQHYFN